VNEAATAPETARRKLAGTLALGSTAALVVVVVRGLAQAWMPARELSWARETGWVAFCTLLLSLSVTPLARIARRVRGTAAPGAALLRRALGMTAAWLALLHALLSVSGTLAGNFTAVWSWPHLRAGLTALIVLLLLLLTSYAPVIALLRVRFFRELHRLAYVAPLLVLQHVLLAPFAPRSLAFGLVLATCVLGLARCL
jgi:DMSO/TMAO reductase YedYZ heme-binding membrane subunit